MPDQPSTLRQKIGGAALLLLLAAAVVAKLLGPEALVHVKGYTKKDGTQVAPHSRRK